MKAGFPCEAYKKFTDLTAVDYITSKTILKEALTSTNRLEEVRLAKEIAEKFRQQYQETAKLAREGK